MAAWRVDLEKDFDGELNRMPGGRDLYEDRRDAASNMPERMNLGVLVAIL